MSSMIVSYPTSLLLAAEPQTLAVGFIHGHPTGKLAWIRTGTVPRVPPEAAQSPRVPAAFDAKETRQPKSADGPEGPKAPLRPAAASDPPRIA